MAKQSPIEMLYVIASHKKLADVKKIFEDHGISHFSVMMGKGTANSTLGDIFGFGIIDRDIITTVVPVKHAGQILDELNEALKLDVPHNGVAFTTTIDAITSDVLDIMNIKLEDLK